MAAALLLFLLHLAAGNAPCRLGVTERDLDLKEHAHSRLVEVELEYARGEAPWWRESRRWSLATAHGRTLLGLPFTRGVLSLNTLSIGTTSLKVTVQDSPADCLRNVTSSRRQLLLTRLVASLFVSSSVRPRLHRDQSVCYQSVTAAEGTAEFTYTCCFADTRKHRKRSARLRCGPAVYSPWIAWLHSLTTAVRVVAPLLVPLAIPSALYAVLYSHVPYVVKIKDTLFKTLAVTKAADKDTFTHYNALHVIDLREAPESEYQRLREVIPDVPQDKVMPVKVKEYHIQVNYERLLTEDRVPVGLFNSLYSGLFLCTVAEVSPCDECCVASMLGCGEDQYCVTSSATCAQLNRRCTWVKLCRFVGMLMVIVCAPVLFYLRLVMYYLCEQREVMHRRTLAAEHNLRYAYDYRYVQYLGPTHPGLLATYVIYFLCALTLAVRGMVSSQQRMRKVLTGAMKDLSRVSYLTALGMVARNFLWPFKRFGVKGFFVGLVYWPAVLPVCLVIVVGTCVPLLFVCNRLVSYFRRIVVQDLMGAVTHPGLRKCLTPVPSVVNTWFQVDRIAPYTEHLEIPSTLHRAQSFKRVTNLCVRITMDVVTCVCVLLGLVGVMLLLADCMAVLVEMGVFTTMGVIVNAGTALKYVSLLLLIMIYGYGMFKSVYRTYSKLNKALFSEIKDRIKGWKEFVATPSDLQENRGFKAQEISEQQPHETPDRLTDTADREEQDNESLYDHHSERCATWTINDLVLFIDSFDTPRIPRRLFEEVCLIRVPGGPGPVYKRLLGAGRKFLGIVLFLVFVFIVVQVFGGFYQMSASDQTLATVAGGSIPFFLRRLLFRGSSNIELDTLSFKSKLGELVQNYYQQWPLDDFVFSVDTDFEQQLDDSDPDGEERNDKRPLVDERCVSSSYTMHRERFLRKRALRADTVSLEEQRPLPAPVTSRRFTAVDFRPLHVVPRRLASRLSEPDFHAELEDLAAESLVDILVVEPAERSYNEAPWQRSRYSEHEVDVGEVVPDDRTTMYMGGGMGGGGRHAQPGTQACAGGHGGLKGLSADHHVTGGLDDVLD